MAHSIRLWLDTQMYWISIPTVSDACHRGCAYTVLQTAQKPGGTMLSMVLCTISNLWSYQSERVKQSISAVLYCNTTQLIPPSFNTLISSEGFKSRSPFTQLFHHIWERVPFHRWNKTHQRWDGWAGKPVVCIRRRPNVVTLAHPLWRCTRIKSAFWQCQKRHGSNAVSMLGHPLRPWPNIKSALHHCLLFCWHPRVVFKQSTDCPAQQTQYSHPNMVHCWPTVCGAGPTS